MATASDEPAKEMVHKTKIIQFLGRTTPIILQNDNGPCPLLAICNVLLLRNNLNLSPDVAEVSQEKLLSLVAERLIDSNSDVNNKDAGYVENQQQNIADAIDLLPRLTTGIDVNIKFRRIDDFEFTRECAIFDLLDIPLYHGWIVDPQDSDTAAAIGLKSYNTLMGELVTLETQNLANEYKKNPEEDCVDFAAATTASLGVPSPSLSRGRSFDDSPRSVVDDQTERKGDREEEEELLRALKISEIEFPATANDAHAMNAIEENISVNTDESVYIKKPEPATPVTTLEEVGAEIQNCWQQEPTVSDDNCVVNDFNDNLITFETIPEHGACLPLKGNEENPNEQSNSEASEEHGSKNIVDEPAVDRLITSGSVSLSSSESLPPSLCEKHMHNCRGDEQIQEQSLSTASEPEMEDMKSSCQTLDTSHLSTPNTESHSSNGTRHNLDLPEAFTSSADGSEPMYEGEECILEAGTASFEREPMYEGEVILAEQVDKGSSYVDDTRSKDDITPKQGELIRNFLKNSASQLTIYGLFCLQDGLKERELCVFFRNNHFNTMFKLDGELYLLATDQGYINQPDLVWEKLNEVNGDTLFMTGNFKEFKVDDHGNSSWDEHNAMANTADYLASIDNSAEAPSGFNSDLQLAIALQQQEFEQQPQQQRTMPQQIGGGSRLVTGPQVPRTSAKNSSSSSRQEPKSSKDKCVVM